MDFLKDIFMETLEREGRIIEVNQKQEKVFFRMNGKDSTTSNSYLEVYSLKESTLQTGDIFEVNGIKHLVIRRYTPENDIYQKFIAVKLNQHVKYMLGKDLVEFDLYQFEIADKTNSGDVITLGSNAKFNLPLNVLTKQIKINDRFFCGSFHAVWKIREMDYKENVVILYCERDVITECDDIENGIADRFSIETPPEPQPSGDIKVEPSYDESDCFAVLHHDTQTFTASIEGITNPQWKITLDAQGVAESYYESLIDNAKGTFKVTNNKPCKTKLKYTINEITSGKTTEYFVKLAALF